MALIETSPETEFPNYDQLEQLATVYELKPPVDQSVLMLEQTPLPIFPEVAVEKAVVKRRSDLDNPDATYYQRNLTFTDGTKRNDIFGQVKIPKSDILVDSAPAWWTSLYEGVNYETDKRLNTLGYNTHRTGIATNKATSMYRNAWDMNATLESLEVSFDVDTTHIYAQGDSNGAMTGIGEVAYADMFDREVLDFYFVDACLIEKIGSSVVKKFIKHPDYIACEVISFIKQASRTIKNGEIRAADLAKTTQPGSSEYLIGNLLLTRALTMGVVGHLAANMPMGQNGTLHMFEHSIANQKQRLIQVTKGSDGKSRSGIDIVPIPGVHLSILNPRTMKAKIDYFRNLLS